MSEAELHIMRARLEQGRWHKAERGELGLPRGYLKHPRARWCSIPTNGSATPSGLSSTSLSRRGSVHGVMRYLNDHGIALPDRARNGPARGEIVWRPPHRGAILNMLTSPAYAGAYVFGRRIGRPDIKACRRRAGQPSRRPEGWRVLLPDRWPAYIAWSTYEENQKRLNANRSKHKACRVAAPPCSPWGSCTAAAAATAWSPATATTAGPAQHARAIRSTIAGHAVVLSGGALDELVTSLVLEVLRPSAIEAGLQLAEDVEIERAQRHRQWRVPRAGTPARSMCPAAV